MKAILFLGTSLVSAQYLRESVERLGLRPIFLLKIDDYSNAPRKAIEACEHYEADVNSLEDILRAIREHDFMREVVAVTSLLDETFQHACYIAEKFNIAGPDSALTQLTDKALVRQMIPEFTPPSLTFTLSTISEELINNFFKEHASSQFMLKPGVSSGAVGISILNKDVAVSQIKQLILCSTLEKADQQSWMLQPRIAGRLHSLEGYVKNKEIFFLGFSRRVRKELTEVVNEFPVDEEIPYDLQKKCREAVTSLVQRSSYHNGYFHCEFIINSEAAYFIDGNMGRVAGGAIVQQLALVYAKEPVDIIKHVIDLGVFKGINTSNFNYLKANEERTLLIYYCLDKPAAVLSISSPEGMTSFHTQIVGSGKEMPSVGVSDSAWVGFLAGFKETVLEEIQHLVINTNKGPVSPFYALVE